MEPDVGHAQSDYICKYSIKILLNRASSFQNKQINTKQSARERNNSKIAIRTYLESTVLHSI